MYLIESLKYDVPAFHEDRLTQIVSATFNHSPRFQKLFLKFLKVPFLPKLSARTQVGNEAAPSRPDLVIERASGSPYVLIESKVDAKADRGQQERHARMKAAHNFLFVRDPVIADRVASRFKKVTWCDFFGHLAAQPLTDLRSTDQFLIHQLLNYGDQCEMLLPERISVQDMKMACKFLTQTRLRRSPGCGFSGVTPFRSLENISLFLERVILKFREDPYLGRRLSPFSRNLGLGSMHDLNFRAESKELKADPFELRVKSESVTIEKSIQLKRKIHGHSKVFLRFAAIPHFKRKETIEFSAKRCASLKINQIHYRGEVTLGLSQKNGTFLYEDCLAFDDVDAIEFTPFYRDAIRHLKKKLA